MTTVELRLPPEEAANETIVRERAAKKLGCSPADINALFITRRSLDARSRDIWTNLYLEVYLNGEQPIAEPRIIDSYKDVSKAPRVIIVGAGPAGYFAALELLELGLKPIIVERGKDVRARRVDLKDIQQYGKVNPHSNYCFGEGGAGTYSDGKLYTRSKKRGEIRKVLKLLVEHGSTPDILVEAHPHIGSNKLPNVVAEIRHTIEKHGGEVHFDAFVTDFILDKGTMKGVILNNGKDELRGEAVILATGHSARDIFYLLDKRGIRIEAKPFALGVRIEHPQSFIDSVQYRQSPRNQYLPAASYALACQVRERGVFSFCMCPGGLIVPAATAPGELVVNGMSMSRRDSPFANSGMVVQVELEDLKEHAKHGVFTSLEFQKSVEQTLFNHGDGSQRAPAQRLTDFVNGRLSNSLNDTSYLPGIYSAPLHDLLPKGIAQRLRDGLKTFGTTMRGYYTEEANLVGTESRTSSPVRIPRDAESLMHPSTRALFPCGEGAGYAGGIVSAAMDGQNVARGVAKFLGV